MKYLLVIVLFSVSCCCASGKTEAVKDTTADEKLAANTYKLAKKLAKKTLCDELKDYKELTDFYKDLGCDKE